MAEWLNLAASRFWNHPVDRLECREEFGKCFGCSPEDCVFVWQHLVMLPDLRADIRDYHLLWTYHMCKHYKTISENAMTVGTSDRTFRDKTKYLIDKISSLSSQLVSDMMLIIFFSRVEVRNNFFSDPLFGIVMDLTTDCMGVAVR